jgi:hypothetical protein
MQNTDMMIQNRICKCNEKLNELSMELRTTHPSI